MNIKFLFFLFSLTQLIHSQTNVSLYNQFSGKVDFTFVGNTLNKAFNGLGGLCEINTQSTANLTLDAQDNVLAAYLYWAGSGTGDFDIKLNNTPVTAQRTFSYTYTVSASGTPVPFFSAFADVTSQIQQSGSGNYTVSELDLTQVITSVNDYCLSGTNFGGWALLVVVDNPTLPFNQVNVYDGLQGVPNQLTITLSNLNVVDVLGAKVGFIAWEGDLALAVNETLTFNGTVLSDPPLNPMNNAFNGTNSQTGDNALYNMDLDIYSIENFINIGDSSASISLTSGQDFVMINTVVTKLNSSPQFNEVDDLIACDLGYGSGWFDFSSYATTIAINSTDVVTFYQSYQDAYDDVNSITSSNDYLTSASPTQIFARITDPNDFFSITSFNLLTEPCAPKPYNAVSVNQDGKNETFYIEGLRGVFFDFVLEIYNRWGDLLWVGDHNKPDWNGQIKNKTESSLAPDGTYYYILHLNHPEFEIKTLNGYLYLTK